MDEYARLMPGRPVPPLRVGTVGGPCWRLCDQKPRSFNLVVFHRGLHCPASEAQVREFESGFDALQARGVCTLAVSCDDRERAERTAEAWEVDRLTLCWGLDAAQAAAWGLYVSRGSGRIRAGVEEPDLYVEPAMFLVRPDGILHGGMVQTMALCRPRLDDVLGAIDAAAGRSAPPREAGVAAE